MPASPLTNATRPCPLHYFGERVLQLLEKLCALVDPCQENARSLPHQNEPGKRFALPESSLYALRSAYSDGSEQTLLYEWDWVETERELKRAQILNPNYADAHQLYAAYLEAMGRFDEALVEANRAHELDPLLAMFSMEVGTTLYFARQYPAAIAQLEKTVNLEPRYVEAHFYLGQAYEQKRMYRQAIAIIQKVMTQAERHPQLIASLGHAYALSGERDEAQQALAELRELSKHRYISPYLFAIVYAGLGDKDQTFAWLNKAYQDRSFFLIWLKVEPLLDPLRADKRFQDLLQQVGLIRNQQRMLSV